MNLHCITGYEVLIQHVVFSLNIRHWRKGYNMKMKQLTKIVMCWELFEHNVPKGHIATNIGVHRETVRELTGTC